MARILKTAEAIRQWAEARSGNPMLMEVPSGTGDENVLLTLSFGQHALDADAGEGADRPTPGYRLVGWDEWLAALEGKHLALKVRDRTPGVLDNDFEFVDAEGERELNDAAEKPPAIVTEPPGAARRDRTRR